MIRKGINIALVGTMGSGKTYFCKQKIRQLGGKCFVNDINYEYNEADILNMSTSEPFNIKKYLSEVNNKAAGVPVIYEEATNWISHSFRNDDLLRMLTGKRHKRVVNIILFHSLASLPLYVYNLLNYLVIFHTDERADIIEKRFSSNQIVIEAFNAQKKKGEHQNTIINFKKN